MEKAFYGVDGDYVDLATFVDRQGSTDPKKWTVKPICGGCGKTVCPVNVKAALHFGEVSREVAARAQLFDRETSSPHFRHYKNEGKGCHYANEDDPFFEPFKKNDFSERAKEKVRDVLFSSEIKEFNGKVLRRFYRDLTGKSEIPKAEGLIMWHQAEKGLGTMSVLVKNPWIYPFAQILFAGERARIFQNSGQKILSFRAQGEQTITFSDIDGRTRYAFLPQKIALCFVNRRGSYVTYGPYKPYKGAPQLCYDVSESAAAQIAGVRPRFLAPRETGESSHL